MNSTIIRDTFIPFSMPRLHNGKQARMHTFLCTKKDWHMHRTNASLCQRKPMMDLSGLPFLAASWMVGWLHVTTIHLDSIIGTHV